MNAQPEGITANKPCLPPYSALQRYGVLTGVLRDVSRSFYLTLRVLPKEVRDQIGVAYLLARAADTIADTRVVPREERLARLLLFRKQLEREISGNEIEQIRRDLAPLQNLGAEKVLLERLNQCFSLFTSFSELDQRLIAEVVIILTRGMEFDLTRFPGESTEHLTSLDKPEELDQYTYYVAGCVGPFWTKMCAAHLKDLEWRSDGVMEELGIRFGKGLQLCNVLRDIPKDLRIGRCYLPASELAGVGLKPADLLDPASSQRLAPLYNKHLDLALAHLAAGWQYTMAVPASLPRLRLACAWPVLIGLKTLAKLRNNPYTLNPNRRIKISRREVYGIMARTLFTKRNDAALNRYYERLVQEAMGAKE